MNLVPSQEMNLTFDGSGLGEHKLRDVISEMTPTNPKKTNGTLVVSCRLHWGGNAYPVLLKRIVKKVQILLDELKPLFKLEKMGTHLITLDESISRNGPGKLKTIFRRTRYLVIRIEERLKYLDLSSVSIPTTKNKIEMKHKLFIKELQKIIFFKELFRTPVGVEEILATHDPNSGRLWPLSINEMTSKELKSYYKLPKKIEHMLDGRRYVREYLLIDMFDLTEENYETKLQQVKEEMNEIAIRCACQELFYLTEHVYQTMFVMMKHHFNPWRDDY
ncbi:MAG: hypothetical protein ACYCQJ_14655 [Nitrososphaerales archaeon]